MRLRMRHFLVALMLGCSAVPAFAQRDKVAVVTAVNPKAVSQVPHRQIKPLVIGHPVVRNEKLATLDNGQVQLLLADQSTLTLAQNSAVVINDFAFDRRTGMSRLTATITAGVVRYVGSKANQQGSVQFLTPSGPVSIDGSGGALITVKPKRPSSG
jgi:hypothetical protein